MFKFLILFFLLAGFEAKRISEEKCQEYKDMLKEYQCVGFSVFDDCPSRIVTYECGDVKNTGLIVGGVEAKPGEFPHMAAIGWEVGNKNLAFKCGGSLISDRFVLTAAHCGWDPQLGSTPKWVRLGVQNLALTNGSALVQLKIKKFIKHPDYDITSKLNDIALIELEGSVKFDRKLLRPACLQQQEFFEPNVTATGWGQNKTSGQTMDTLMRVLLPVVDFKKCQGENEELTLSAEKQICAGGVEKKDTCGGDSGAPIQFAHRDAPCVYDIVGFTAFGGPICGKGHAVYTKTSHYLDWIENIVWPKPVETTTKSRYVTRGQWIW